MNKAKFIPLRDIKDNLGNFTGYSVDDDGVIVNTSDCPFPFFDGAKKKLQIFKSFFIFTPVKSLTNLQKPKIHTIFQNFFQNLLQFPPLSCII